MYAAQVRFELGVFLWRIGVTHVLADQGFGRLAVELDGAAVQEHELAGRIDLADQRRQVFRDGAQPALARFQLFARGITLRDVGEGDDGTQCAAVRARQRSAAGQHRRGGAARRRDRERLLAHDVAAQHADQRHFVGGERRVAVGLVQRIMPGPVGRLDAFAVEIVQHAGLPVEQREVAFRVARDDGDVDRFQHGVQQFLLFLELLARAVALRDVVDERADAAPALPFVGPDLHFDGDAAAARGERRQLDLPVDDRAGPRLREAAHARGVRGAQFFRHDQVRQRTADGLASAPAEDPFGGRVPFRDPALGIGADEGAVGRRDDRAVPAFGVAQFGEAGVQFGRALGHAHFKFRVERLEGLFGHHARRRDAGLVQFHLDEVGQVAQALALPVVEAARVAVDDAQRTHGLAVAVQRLAGVEADVRRTLDEGTLGETRVRGRILDDQHLALRHGVGADRMGAGRLLDVQAAARLEPLALVVHQRDERDGHAEGHRGQACKTVEAGLRPGIQQVERGQGREARSFRDRRGHQHGPSGWVNGGEVGAAREDAAGCWGVSPQGMVTLNSSRKVSLLWNVALRRRCSSHIDSAPAW